MYVRRCLLPPASPPPLARWRPFGARDDPAPGEVCGLRGALLGRVALEFRRRLIGGASHSVSLKL